MSEAKFSKGPWPISCVEHETMIADWYVDIGGMSINLFPYKRIYSEDRSMSGLVLDQEKKANMQIIAAAPELYEALDAASNYIDVLGGDSKRYRAALEKARGEA